MMMMITIIIITKSATLCWWYNILLIGTSTRIYWKTSQKCVIRPVIFWSWAVSRRRRRCIAARNRRMKRLKARHPQFLSFWIIHYRNNTVRQVVLWSESSVFAFLACWPLLGSITYVSLHQTPTLHHSKKIHMRHDDWTLSQAGRANCTRYLLSVHSCPKCIKLTYSRNVSCFIFHLRNTSTYLDEIWYWCIH
jgi:hypothetical protein